MAGSPIKTSCTVTHENCECFEALTVEQKQLVEEKQRIVHYKKGEIIAKHGAFASHVIFLCEGLVKVYYESGQNNLILKIVSPGNLIGLTSLQKDENIFRFTASAYVDSVARLIDLNLFKQFIHENGDFASAIVNIMSENANQINGRFFALTHRQSYGKLADLILCLAGNVFKSDQFQLHLTRKELAELAGMSTESAIRILKKFQDEGYIKITGKSFQIVDVEGLTKICELG